METRGVVSCAIPIKRFVLPVITIANDIIQFGQMCLEFRWCYENSAPLPLQRKRFFCTFVVAENPYFLQHYGFSSCHNAIMVVTGRAHCSILLYITLQIHSVEHSYGLGGESLRETFTICIMYRSLLAVWALWWLHNAILQCVTVHRVPKFTSCHNAIMVVTGRAHCSILLYIYIYIYIYICTLHCFLHCF